MNGFGLFEKRVIGRHDSPLLTRWTLLRTPWFTLKLHRFHRSDPSCLHDHPWPFVSLILAGGYYEETEVTIGVTTLRGSAVVRDGSFQSTQRRWYGPGSLLFRPATWRHRVVLRVGVEPLTLVLTGKRVREWGFWTRARGFVRWQLFGAAEDDC